MKKRLIIILSIIFFLLVNTSYFWKKLPGLWDFLIIGILFLGFIVLTIILIIQIVKLIRNKFSKRITIINCAILTITLILTIIFPFGILDSNKFEGKNLIFAQYEGVANCTESLKIKEKNRFIQSSVCFGKDDYSGNYEIRGDTIKLFYDKKSSFDSKYAYGIIVLDSIKTQTRIGKILYYRDSSDNNPLPMKIFAYKLNEN
jgi:hypothetical protein